MESGVLPSILRTAIQIPHYAIQSHGRIYMDFGDFAPMLKIANIIANLQPEKAHAYRLEAVPKRLEINLLDPSGVQLQRGNRTKISLGLQATSHRHMPSQTSEMQFVYRPSLAQMQPPTPNKGAWSGPGLASEFYFRVRIMPGPSQAFLKLLSSLCFMYILR